MIKAIIADVDGVMVGKQEGVNFPLPHEVVLGRMKAIAAGGVPIILCTAKFRYAIDEIIIQAHLDNPHISDGGALIINPLGEPKIIEEHMLDTAIVDDYLSRVSTYTELYDSVQYYALKNAEPEFRQKRAKLLQKEPVLVDSLRATAATADILKIISYSDDDADMPKLEATLHDLADRVHFIWTQHPFIAPRRPLVITARDVSKEHAAKKVADYLGISLEDMLGIGDSPSDWSFMQLCGYGATVGNNVELRRLVAGKGEASFAGGSVDDQGVLEIFDHFEL